MAHLLVMLGVEMHVGVRPEIRPTEGCLHRKRVDDSTFTPHHHAPGALLATLHLEVAIPIAEHLGILPQEAREHFLTKSAGRVQLATVAPVDEDVLLATVAMEVAVHHHLPVQLKPFQHHLGVIDTGVEAFAGFNPLSVEVLTAQAASVVAVHNTVGVKHRHNLKHKIVTQNLRVERRPSEIVYQTFHHPRRIRLPRVNTRCNQNALP
mmetsp:Transcript_10971/g.23210  ORF Transcript_10971/g.23210 Transcript_10971/m.23210 type:complete len:208 (+) Transcript_10971:435-1058(+)